MEISDELRAQLAEDRRCVVNEIEQIENQVLKGCVSIHFSCRAKQSTIL